MVTRVTFYDDTQEGRAKSWVPPGTVIKSVGSNGTYKVVRVPAKNPPKGARKIKAGDLIVPPPEFAS
jgi:hypothetical protein